MMVKAGVAAAVVVGGLQTLLAPPMKTGLWETTTSTRMQMPGGQMPPARAMKIRSCVTADSWSRAFGQMRQASRCSRVNENRTATRYSFDLSCPNLKGHGDMDFGGGNSGHGTMHVEADAGGKSMVVDTTWDSKYLGADCGAVTPMSPQIIQ